MLKSRRACNLSAAALLTEFVSTLAHDRGTTVDLLIQPMLADGKLHLSAASLLATHLRTHNGRLAAGGGDAQE